MEKFLDCGVITTEVWNPQGYVHLYGMVWFKSMVDPPELNCPKRPPPELLPGEKFNSSPEGEGEYVTALLLGVPDESFAMIDQ